MSGQSISYITVQEAVNGGLGKSVGSANRLPTELQNSALIRELEDINSEFHERGREMMKKPFWWMEAFKNFKTYDRTTIGALVASTTTSAALASSTGWPTSGRFFVEDADNGSVDFIDFTALSGSTVTLTPATIDIDHSSSSNNAELLYAVPSNFGEFISMTLDRIPYYMHDGVPDTLPSRPYFVFQGSYFLFPSQIGNHTATLRYWRAPATVSTGNDQSDLGLSLDIPKKYRNFAFFKLAAHISLIRKRYDLEQRFLQRAEEVLMQAVRFEVSATASPFSTIGPSW